MRKVPLIAFVMCVFLAACDHASSNRDGGAEDLAQACTSTSCQGGTRGCSSMCPSGCPGGQLCCPWSGGACQLTDAGTCANNGGFSCAMPTTDGVCPNRCYP